ncbi:MAG: hypothetical protein QOJ79_2948 [Actinomycetota bacterium]|jgi:glycosyltransferase involved in cell wall biosynthesis|nr:hypothetical protein [Actinomycetota bacterium]
MPGSRLTVVIPTLRRPASLPQVLVSLRASDPPPFEVLVVDGDPAGSAAEVTATAAAEAPYPVRHVPSAPGLTRQRNVGLEVAAGDVVLFLDDDARPEPGVVGLVLAAYDDPLVVGVTGHVAEPASNAVGGKSAQVRRWLPGGGEDGAFTRFGYPRRLRDESQDRDVAFMQGCFLSARRDLARTLRFDEALPGYGLAEDEDFSCRLSRCGRIRFLAAAVVHHDNDGFGGRDRRAFGRQVVRHRRYLFRKNFTPTPLARIQFGLLLAGLAAHRLANRDVLGARGVLEEVLRPRPLAG